MPPVALTALKGTLYLTRPSLMPHIANRANLDEMAADLFKQVTSGKVKIRIDQRYAMADAAQAHRDIEARKTTGPDTAAAVTVQPDRRFTATGRLLGGSGLSRLQAGHAVVVGIGGVGSWAAEALARTGVGRLTLIDLDQIVESNINRQVHALESTLGAAKVDVMARRIREIAPQARRHRD